MKEYTTIPNTHITIPALLWGQHTDRLIIAVHGDQSNKEDTIIELLAKHATTKGYQVLSFDLPEHGARSNSTYSCNPPNCVSDLRAVYAYAQTLSSDIFLFACSLGAYFSLLAYRRFDLKKTLFLSPVVDMERVLQSMMNSFHVTEERLEAEKTIPLPIGKTLDWNYYAYVRQHPVDFGWGSPISLLYGSEDVLTSRETIENFSKKLNASLNVMENGEHYFHTAKQLWFFEEWLEDNLS